MFGLSVAVYNRLSRRLSTWFAVNEALRVRAPRAQHYLVTCSETLVSAVVVHLSRREVGDAAVVVLVIAPREELATEGDRVVHTDELARER